jgi:transglutaminase-like putative cysteine protease
VFTLGTRGRFIGSVLIATALLLIPAFWAEIAGYAPEMSLLIAGMFGLYALWVAHEPEGFHNIWTNYFEARGINGKKGTKRKSERKPIYKITPGNPPLLYKYSINALLTVALALTACVTAAKAVPDAVKFDFRKIAEAARQIPVELPQSVQRFFKYKFGRVNDNGYFPNSSVGISKGISINRPPKGKIPIIRINLDDDSEKIYLKGGIGIDFTGAEWTTGQNSSEYRDMIQLTQTGFYPESEYHNFIEAVSYAQMDGLENDISGRQEVDINYLVKTEFLLLPTTPDELNYKENPDYYWYSDTYISPKNRVEIDKFYVLYPKLSAFNEMSLARSFLLPWEWYFRNGNAADEEIASLSDDKRLRVEAVYGGRGRIVNFDWNIPYEIYEYRGLINQIYTAVPESETENIDRLLREIWVQPITAYDYDYDFGEDVDDAEPALFTLPPDDDPMITAQAVDTYLRDNYDYSLETDNAASQTNTAIGSFLHETREGHCAMYASAMTLAMRRLGFPARYVTGIVTVPGGGKTQSMSERDFHAWVEVYFEGIGWIPFDPTGGVNGQERAASPADTTAAPAVATPPATGTPPVPKMSEAVPDMTAAEKKSENNNNSSSVTIVIIALIAVISAGTLTAAIKALGKAESDKFARFKRAGDNSVAREMYRFMFRLLGSEGITRLSGETPLEFGARVDSKLELGKSLDGIMPLFEKIEFGNTDLTAEEYDLISEYITALYKKAVLDKKRAERLFKRIRFGR